MQLKRYLLLFISLIIVACSEQNEFQTFQGYMEGEYLYMAPSVSGHLNKLFVQRGQFIPAQQLLFSIDNTDELEQLKANKAQLKNAEALLGDMLTGERPSEIGSILAQINQAKSAKKLADINLKRDKQQYAIGAITQAQLDNSQNNEATTSQRLAELQYNLTTAKLPRRQQQISAQRALVAYAKANVADAEWRLSQTLTKAQEPALVYDTLYNPGEWIEAGSPVVVLLPKNNLKVRFFVSEKMLSHLRLGEPVTIICDGCKKNIEANVSYISSQAEFTSPLIFSNDTREQLTFRIEAKPKMPNLLTMHPGQPVEVRIHD